MFKSTESQRDVLRAFENKILTTIQSIWQKKGCARGDMSSPVKILTISKLTPNCQSTAETALKGLQLEASLTWMEIGYLEVSSLVQCFQILVDEVFFLLLGRSFIECAIQLTLHRK